MTKNENPATVLMETVLESIENMAFADVERISGNVSSADLLNHVKISMGHLGSMDMAIDDIALKGLASVILSIEPNELNDEAKQDTLMEIINIVAGRFCHQMVDEKEEFSLGLPTLGESEESESNSAIVCSFAMDGEPALQFRYFPQLKQIA